MSPKREQLPPIVSTCYFNASRKGEHFIPDHVFSYQIAGTMVVNDGQREYVFIPGEFRFFKRNQLARYTKLPPPDGGGFKTMAICFTQKVLREFSATYGYAATKKDTGPAFRHLTDTAMYKSYMDSLIPYLVAEQQMDEDLINLKLKEALLILLKVNPELKDVLFDFTEPGKIDLEAFMQKNFHFKVGLQRFAYMTGRSLATFKRDFEKIFNLPPSRWLVQRRLQEAYYRIKELGKRPSEVYLELGFEDFSHFSYAFRQAYGVAPSKLKPGL